MTTRPDVAPAVPWTFPEPVTRRLDNGLSVLLYPAPGQHVAAVRLHVPAPTSAEPRDREGVARLVSRTMDEGTRSHTAEELAELFEHQGISLSAASGEQGIDVDVDCTTGRLEVGLTLLTECLSEPIFDEGEVRRHRRHMLSELEHVRSRAASRAAVEWSALRYSADCRASRPMSGEAVTLGAVEREDCAEFHRRTVRPEHSTVVVVGDLDVDDTLRTLDRTLGCWRPEGTAELVEPTSLERASGSPSVRLVHRPGAVQTELLLGTAGPSRRTPLGWAPFATLAYLMGGAPQSRIDAVLREEKGYTYGMRSSFRPRARGGELRVQGSVRSEVTAESVSLLLGILNGARDGFSERETRESADYICKTAPARFATADQLADQAVLLAADGLGTQFVTDYLHDLTRLTPHRLAEAWATVPQDDWSLVLVGDADVFEDDVRALGLGAVDRH